MCMDAEVFSIQAGEFYVCGGGGSARWLVGEGCALFHSKYQIECALYTELSLFLERHRFVELVGWLIGQEQEGRRREGEGTREGVERRCGEGERCREELEQVGAEARERGHRGECRAAFSFLLYFVPARRDTSRCEDTGGPRKDTGRPRKDTEDRVRPSSRLGPPSNALEKDVDA